MPVLFKDIGKTATDTLTDDYEFDRKLKIKTKTESGLTLTTEGTMNANNAILAKVSGAFNHSSGINVKKLQVTTHGRLIGEACANNALLDGLTLTFKAEDGALKNAAGVKYRPVGKIGAEYKTNAFSTTTEADFANNAINASTVLGYQSFFCGGEATVSVDKSALVDKNVAVGYLGNDFHAAVSTKKDLGVISASVHHRSDSTTIYAAVFNHDVKSQTNALSIGGRYCPDKDTTYCGKVDSDGIVSLSCVQKIKPTVAITTSVQIDAKNIERETHKFGMGLTLG